MTFLPIVERELRVTARRRMAFWLRLLAAGGFVALGWMSLSAFRLGGPAASGQGLFKSLTVICWFYCLACGPLLAADVLSAERRQNTLGLLLLTDLRLLDVVWGKAAVAVLHALNIVMAGLPVFAVALLLGGVGLDEMGRSAAALLSTMWLSLGVSMAVSAGCVESRGAFALSAFLMWALAVLMPSTPVLGWFSPAVLMEKVYGSKQFSPASFWESCLAVQALGWSAFAAAAWILWRVARHEARASRVPDPASWRHRWMYGRPEVRQRWRRRMLDRNPWAWLAGRNRLKGRVLLLLVTPLLPAWMLWGEPNDFELTLLALWLIQFLLKILITAESSQLLANTRQAGSFELILSTPLTPEQIIVGQRNAIARTFFWPVAVTALLGNLLILPRFSGWERLVPPLFTLTILFDFATLNRLAFWRGLAARRAYLVVPGVMMRVLFWPALLFLPTMPVLLDFGSPWPFLFVWALFFGIGDALQHSFATDMLRSDLRREVAERFPATRRPEG